MSFLKRNISFSILLLCIIIGGGITLYSLWIENQHQKAKQTELLNQLKEAQETQKEATITRRISTQLEEIAYQQKEISDIQKQEAVNQTKIADEMRKHAESEREKALSAQEAAIQAYGEMEEQKRIAETRREEAIAAQMKADTLARLALGRSLGSQASTQYSTGNKDLASLLSYAAWKFTSENKGDIYQPAIFDALSRTSNLSEHWNLHAGAIRHLTSFQSPKGTFILSASQYGELYLWSLEKENLRLIKVLVKNPTYDFRKVILDTVHKQCFALSFSGALLIINDKAEVKEIPLTIPEPFNMVFMDNQLFIASRKGSIYKADIETKEVSLLYQHDTKITAFQQVDHSLLLGDEDGRMYQLTNESKVSLLGQTLKQPITAIYQNKQQDLQAIGYKSGIIIVQNLRNSTHKELIGHISPITEMSFSNGKLFTSSYDGTVRLWNIDNANKIASSIVYQPNEWIHSFITNNDGTLIFTGDEKGNLSLIPTSPEYMAKRIKQNLSRNFTQEEWDYYIGELSEYETYK